MSAIKWLEGNRIQIAPPKKTKKITGTRFATILGLNPWSTAFEMWCAITKTYEKPFEDTIYTIAGKTIEPKQAAYMKKSYAMDIITPTDIWGRITSIRLGVISSPTAPPRRYVGLSLSGEDGKVDAVLEMKTTKRAEDWENDVPEYYALQAALYAYLLGVDDVIMVASFLEENDYEDPKKFKPSAKNTITVEFKVSSVTRTSPRRWLGSRSGGKIMLIRAFPEYDEKKDAEILTALRTNTLTPETDIEALVAEAESLKKELDEVAASTAEKEKRLKTINDIIKEHAMSQFRDGDKKVEVKGSVYVWTVSRSETTGIDKDALKADGLLDKYSKKSVQYRMTVK